MEPPDNSETIIDANHTDESVSFADVSAVATAWGFDFMFLSLCRYFKEDKLDEFNEVLSTFEAIYQSPSLKGKRHDEKVLICAFLSRVMHGKQLDVQFEEDAGIMPLMSAANIWSKLEDTVEDKCLFKNIVTLLLVQSVALCLETGRRSSVSSVLKWFKNNYETVGVKLLKVVAEMDTRHPYLLGYSFSRLVETVQSYLDSYLERNPSDYLLKAATKMVQSSRNMESSDGMAITDSSLPDSANKSTQDVGKKDKTSSLRMKRKLLSTKITDAWEPDSCKKAFISIRRLSDCDIRQMTSKRSVTTPRNNTEQKRRKTHQKWTQKQDRRLKKGIKRHGVGRWSRILMDYDFEGRTAMMLKDRWRVLVRTDQVDG